LYQTEHSSFCKDQARPEIQEGSPRARALNDSGVRIGVFRSLSHRNSETVQGRIKVAVYYYDMCTWPIMLRDSKGVVVVDREIYSRTTVV